MRWLPVASTCYVNLGPFLSNSDFKTPVTNLTLSSGQVYLLPNGGGAAVDLASRTFTHVANGVYKLALLASDVQAPGPITFVAACSGCVPIKQEAAACSLYQSLFGSTTMPADMVKINGDATAAAILDVSVSAALPFTVGTGSTATTITTDIALGTNSALNGRRVVMISGTLSFQAADIEAYNGSTHVLTVTGFTNPPSVGDRGLVI